MKRQSSTTVAPYVRNTLAKANVNVEDVTGFYVKMIRVVGGKGQQATGEAYVIAALADGSERVIFHAKGSKVKRRRGAHEWITETQYSTKKELETIWASLLNVPIITTSSSKVEGNMKSRKSNKYATVHARLRTLGVTNESEQRNIYAAVTGKRSLREMNASELHELEAFLYSELPDVKAARAEYRTAPVSDEAAQAWLD